jgi:hypothetical protein
MSPIVAMPTSEAQLIGACACAQEIQFCRRLAAELGFRQYAPTPLFEDNWGCIALAEHGHFAAGPSTFTCAGCLSPILFEMGFSNCTKFSPPSK